MSSYMSCVPEPELKERGCYSLVTGTDKVSPVIVLHFCSFISLLEAHRLSESTITLKPRERITKTKPRDGAAGGLSAQRYNVINSEIFAVLPTRLAQLALRPRSCRWAWSRFYSATWVMDGPECHALIPYLRHQDLSGPPQFLEGCAQLGRDTPGWSLFSAKSLLRYQTNLIVRSRTQSEQYNE